MKTGRDGTRAVEVDVTAWVGRHPVLTANVTGLAEAITAVQEGQCERAVLISEGLPVAYIIGTWRENG